MNPTTQTAPNMTNSRWAMWYKNKVRMLSDEMITQIRVALTDMRCWFEEDLKVVWKHLFLITPLSITMGNLPLDHLVWGLTPNPWWTFLTDTHLIME